MRKNEKETQKKNKKTLKIWRRKQKEGPEPQKDVEKKTAENGRWMDVLGGSLRRKHWVCTVSNAVFLKISNRNGLFTYFSILKLS